MIAIQHSHVLYKAVFKVTHLLAGRTTQAPVVKWHQMPYSKLVNIVYISLFKFCLTKGDKYKKYLPA